MDKSPKHKDMIEYSRMFKIGHIPFLDFVMVYILLHLLNMIYLNYDFLFILVATIPMTILFNLLTNKNMKLSKIVLAILIITISYMVYLIYHGYHIVV